MRYNTPLTVKLYDNLEHVRTVLGYTVKDWSSRLHLTERQYRNQVDPAAHVVYTLSEDLDVSFETLVTGAIDFAALAARKGGHPDTLPARYATAAFSRRRTSINMLQYLEDVFGWRKKNWYLRHFQINEAAFADPEQTINLTFLADLCAKLRRDGFAASEIEAMGAYSALSHRATLQPLLRRQAATTKELFAYIFTSGFVNQYYDRNFHYHLKSLTDDYCIIECTEHEDVLDAMHARRLGNPAVCMMKAGSLSSLPSYIGKQNVSVKKLSCLHRGDPHCSYLVRFSCETNADVLLH